MAARRGQQVQDRHHGELVRYQLLHWADREAGAKVRGVAAVHASRRPAYRHSDTARF
jgi:hypothetical protein